MCTNAATCTIILGPLTHTYRADNDAIFQHHTKHQEDKVEQDHGQAQHLVNLPLTGCNRGDNKEKRDEEQRSATEKPIAADGHWSKTVGDWVQEPREWKSFIKKNIKREEETHTKKQQDVKLYFFFKYETSG